jgi:hypothetical protein
MRFSGLLLGLFAGGRRPGRLHRWGQRAGPAMAGRIEKN